VKWAGSCPKLLETGSESCLQTVPARRMLGFKYLSLASPFPHNISLRSRAPPYAQVTNRPGVSFKLRQLDERRGGHAPHSGENQAIPPARSMLTSRSSGIELAYKQSANCYCHTSVRLNRLFAFRRDAPSVTALWR